MKLKYIVYITTNKCNGKFYIGVHKTNPDVFDGYIGDGIYRLSNACKKFAFHRAVRKYGYENFIRTTIQVFDTELEAFELEKTLVNPILLKSKNCYNTALGGKSNSCDKYKKRVYQFTLNGEFITSYSSILEAAKSIDQSNSYTIKKAIRNNCLGATNSSYGFFWSYKKLFTYSKPECWRKIALYTLTGQFILYYDNITQAEELLRINTIKQAITKGYTAGGYLWRYYENDLPITSLITTAYKNKVLPILMINLKTGQTIEYSSIKECVKENKELKAAQINRVLKSIIKTHKGYTFKYKDEDIV